MSFNREKYAKPEALETINEGLDEAKKNSVSAKGSGGDFTKTVYHQLEEGDNWFKIAPAHDPEKSPYVPMCVSKLEAEGDVWKDGERTDEKEVKLRNIFIATVHSPKDKNGKLIVSKDPIESYITHLNKIINEQYQDKDEKEKKLTPVKGFRDKDKKWHFGIRPDHKIATWAWNKDWQIGRLDLSNKQRKQLDQLSIKESADDVIATDIFSPLVEGFPVILTKTTTGEGKAKKTEYTTRCDAPTRKQNWDQFWESVTPPDAACEEWASKKSLDELFVGAYSKRDFEMAVDGLERFDKKWKFGVFEDQNFLDEMEEISDMVDKLPIKEEKKETKDLEKADKKAPITSKIKKEIVEKEEVEEVTPMAMKKFLRKYIVDNYDDEQSLPELSPKDLKKWYELAKNNEELPFDLDEEEEEEQEEEKPAAKSKSTPKAEEEIDEEEAEESIANLRARRKK